MTVPSVSRNGKVDADPGNGLEEAQAGEPEGDTVPRGLNVPVGWLPSAGCPNKPEARTAVAAVEAENELRMEASLPRPAIVSEHVARRSSSVYRDVHRRRCDAIGDDHQGCRPGFRDTRRARNYMRGIAVPQLEMGRDNVVCATPIDEWLWVRP